MGLCAQPLGRPLQTLGAARLRAVAPDPDPASLGDKQLSEIRRSDLQRLVNRLMAEGLSASSIRNALLPLRAIYRHALALDEVAVNPTTGVQLPAVRGRPERVASPGEAARLIAALPKQDRALWATAIYAGLRSGELQALADDMVDLDKNIIRVHWGWDPKAGRVAPRVAPAAAPSRSPPRCGCTWSSSSWLAAVAAGFSSVAGAATRSRLRRSASAPSAPGGPPGSNRSACTTASTRLRH